MKKLKLWIYEYKDDNTPLGATIIDEFIDKIQTNEDTPLPHLDSKWHYRFQLYYEDEDEI